MVEKDKVRRKYNLKNEWELLDLLSELLNTVVKAGDLKTMIEIEKKLREYDENDEADYLHDKILNELDNMKNALKK